MMLETEQSHLQEALKLLRKEEKKDYAQVIGEGTFPAPLKLESNIDHVRGILAGTVQITACRESYAPVESLKEDADFFRYQKIVNENVGSVMSHQVIEQHIRAFGQDYRFQVAPHPLPALRDRKTDNTELGRCACKMPEK